MPALARYIFPARRGLFARAFTLIELLVVLTIMGIMVAIAVPALTGIVSSYSLDAAAQGVVAQLTLARQNALVTSHPVQVRFFEVADYNTTSSTPTVYRAMQSFLVGDTATAPLAKPYFFPTPIRVFIGNTGGADVSSLLVPADSGIIVPSPTADPANPLPPPFGSNYSYLYFRFRPNGQTELSTSVSVTSLLTLASDSSPVKAGSVLPTNYVTIQLNALTGVAALYRP